MYLSKSLSTYSAYKSFKIINHYKSYHENNSDKG